MSEVNENQETSYERARNNRKYSGGVGIIHYLYFFAACGVHLRYFSGHQHNN